MAIQPTYPGVYIEEVPSGVRTITGVSTSVTAFVGRTFKGPVDRATRLTNFGAFEKQFGGLWRESTLSYAIRQFFQNGGTDAIVVRIVDGQGTPSSVTLDNGTPNGIELVEAEAGSSGRSLRVQVTDDGTRHIIVTEIARATSGAEVVVRTADYAGADVAALAAALGADDSLVRLSEETTNFTALPVVTGPVDFAVGTSSAQAARAPLPIAGGNLVITAAAVGETGNNIAVTILPSATEEELYSIVVEQRQADGTYAPRGTVTGVTNASVQAAIAGPGRYWRCRVRQSDELARTSVCHHTLSPFRRRRCHSCQHPIPGRRAGNFRSKSRSLGESAQVARRSQHSGSQR